MCPDVDRLGVDVEDGAEAGVEGGHRRPVRLVDVVVVLRPGRQRVERDQPSAGRPDLASDGGQGSGQVSHRRDVTAARTRTKDWCRHT